MTSVAEGLAGWMGVRLASVAADRMPEGGSLGPVDQDPAVVRRDACELLQRASQCIPRATAPPSPQSTPSERPAFALPMGTLLVVVVVVGLLALVAWALITFVRFRRTSVTTADTTVETVVRPRRTIDGGSPPESWRTWAAEHANAGRYRDAIRCQYRALVGDLARRGLLDEVPGTTTGEERSQLLRHDSGVTLPFGSAIELFEQVWYGRLPAESADYEQFVHLDDEVLRATEPA